MITFFLLVIAFLGAKPLNNTDPLSKIIGSVKNSLISITINDLSDKKFDIIEDKFYVQKADIRYYLTLDPKLQKGMERYLKKHKKQFKVATFIAVQPSTGRIIAYVESSSDIHCPHPSLSAKPPTASLFKLVTAFTLVDQKGFSGKEEACIHGGVGMINKSYILENKRLDKRCMSLRFALAKSNNSAIARFAYKNLDFSELKNSAILFGFNQNQYSFPFIYEPSLLTLQQDKIALAIEAAGFWSAHFSPAHGVIIASIIANRGKFIEPFIVDSVFGDYHRLYKTKINPSVVVHSHKSFDKLAWLMTAAQAHGTGIRYIGWHKQLKKIKIACKSGTLSGYSGDPLHYSWFLGFAPVNKPKIAFIAMVGKQSAWGFKSGYIMRRALELFFLKKQN